MTTRDETSHFEPHDLKTPSRHFRGKIEIWWDENITDWQKLISDWLDPFQRNKKGVLSMPWSFFFDGLFLKRKRQRFWWVWESPRTRIIRGQCIKEQCKQCTFHLKFAEEFDPFRENFSYSHDYNVLKALPCRQRRLVVFHDKTWEIGHEGRRSWRRCCCCCLLWITGWQTSNHR